METVIKSYKVNMNMDYSEYASAHPEVTMDDKHKIVTNFVTDLANGQLAEVIRFFNLDSEDIAGLRTDNFTVGYKIINDDTVDHNLSVNIRLDVKVDEERKDPTTSNYYGTTGDTVVMETPEETSNDVVDSEATEVIEDVVDSTAEEVEEINEEATEE